jgi:FtsP/CotA-like multicopper oxidase with cupredoxin domain
MRFIQLTRRRFLHGLGLAGAAAALPAGTGCGDDPVDPPGGDGLPVPPLVEGELEGGVRVFRLELRRGEVDFGAGAPTATYGINGPFLGPTLRFPRGERVRVEVTNSLGEESSLHWHGMQVPARKDGGPYVTIAPGATWTVDLDVDQRPATVWYHPHPMHQTARQVYMGLAGLIYIADLAPRADLPSTYGVDDLPLVIQDRRLFADGTHPYSDGGTVAMHDMMAGLKGSTILVNGAVRPRGTVARGLVRLRVLNGSNARSYHLGFSDGRSFRVIASDGGLLAAPLTATRALVAPGERVELLVDFSADPRDATVTLQSFSGEVLAELFTGMMGANLADELDRTTFDIATFAIGAPLPSTIVPPAAFEPIARGAAGDAVRTRDLAMSMRMGGWYLNGTQMTALEPVPAAISFQIPAGDVELWTVTNSSGVAHPFHVHHRPFQILDIDGAPPPPALAGWKDTVVIGPGRVVRLLIDFAGTPDPAFPYMFHCHILEHEDHGMMGRFFLVEA